MELPTVDTEPPQAVLYQYQLAPELKIPPVKLKVVDVPGHIAEGLPVAEVAGVEFIFTVTVTDTLLLIQTGVPFCVAST